MFDYRLNHVLSGTVPDSGTGSGMIPESGTVPDSGTDSGTIPEALCSARQAYFRRASFAISRLHLIGFV